MRRPRPRLTHGEGSRVCSAVLCLEEIGAPCLVAESSTALSAEWYAVTSDNFTLYSDEDAWRSGVGEIIADLEDGKLSKD